MKSFKCMLGLVLLSALPWAAQAQPSYPGDKPVKLILPFIPGGSADFAARLLAEKLKERTGGQFLVENKPGAAANLATAYVARAPADGYTILVGVSGALTVNPTLYKNLGFDSLKDFEPITMLAQGPVVVVAGPHTGINTLDDLVNKAKASPQGLNAASIGAGTSHYLASEMFQNRAGFRMNTVHYKGTPDAMQDVIGERVDAGFLDLAGSLPFIKGGRVKALATTGTTRSSALPDVPTIAEAGYPGYQAPTWIAILAPAGTPTDRADFLRKNILAVLEDPDYQTRLGGQGLQAWAMPGQSLLDFMKEEIEKWKPVIKESGIKVE